MPVPDKGPGAIIRSSVEAANGFTEWYYRCLNDARPVAPGYVNNNNTYKAAAHPPADICVNGLVVATPEEWDVLLEKQRHISATPTTTTAAAPTGPASSTTKPKSLVHYDVEATDVHVLNPDYRFAAPPEIQNGTDAKAMTRTEHARIMMMVTASGTVTFGTDDRHALKQHFNDVFILVPNWDVVARPGSRNNRRYLIASHTYRAY